MSRHSLVNEDVEQTQVLEAIEPAWPVADADAFTQSDLPEYEWSQYRRWWQPRFGHALLGRTPGRVRWLTAWTRRGLNKAIERRLGSYRRGWELAEQWLWADLV